MEILSSLWGKNTQGWIEPLQFAKTRRMENRAVQEAAVTDSAGLQVPKSQQYSNGGRGHKDRWGKFYSNKI